MVPGEDQQRGHEEERPAWHPRLRDWPRRSVLSDAPSEWQVRWRTDQGRASPCCERDETRPHEKKKGLLLPIVSFDEMVRLRMRYTEIGLYYWETDTKATSVRATARSSGNDTYYVQFGSASQHSVILGRWCCGRDASRPHAALALACRAQDA